jgi:1-acyl-sn-glycerol-3-phosphate acyltransferase
VKIVSVVRTLCFVVYLILLLALVAPPLMLHAALAGSPDLLFRVAMVLVRSSWRVVGIRVRVEGAENIPSGVCIFVANHVSNIDPPLLVPSVGRRVALLAKQGLFRIPILGRAMLMADFIPVNRSDPEAAAASVESAVRKLRSGVSLLVYPEGTRSPDGRLRPFKRGSFVMAIQAGVRVVPISISGPEKLMRKGEWFVRSGTALIRFGPAVDASAYTFDRRGELLERVHQLVAAGLPEDQRPASESLPNR